MKPMVKTKIQPFIALFVLLLFATSASSSDDDTVKLEDLVVSATKTEKHLEDAPASVSIIGKEDIDLRNVKTVDEALNALSGVYVKRTKGLMDSTSSVRMRGYNNDHYTLILLDGIPVNDAYTAGVEWGMLPVDNIERIEVVRGVGSALYGGNAMGGVINIITRTPKKLEAKLAAGYGSNGTYRYKASAGERLMDRFSLRLGYENESTDGYPTTPVVRTVSAGAGTTEGGYAMNNTDGSAGRWVVGDKGDNGAEKQSFDLKGVYDVSDTGKLSLSGIFGRHKYDYGAPHTLMGTFGDANTYAIAGDNQRARFQPYDFMSMTGISLNETGVFSLSYTDVFGKIKVTALTGTVRTDDMYTTASTAGAVDDYDNAAGTKSKTECDAWFSEIRADIPLGSSHVLTAGLSHRVDDSDTHSYAIPFYRSFDNAGPSTYYAGGKDRVWAVFAQDEWTVAEPFSIYLGARYDAWKVSDGKSGDPSALTSYDSNDDSQVSPKAAFVYKPLSGMAVKGSAGTAFRAPTLYELYRTWVSGSTTYQSNPNLKPETAVCYDLGVEQTLFDKTTRFALTGFRNEIEDMIYYRTTVDGGNTTKARINAGEARTYGLEAEVSQKIGRMVSVWGNYTYTDAKITKNETDPDSEGKTVTGIPENAWSLGADLTSRWVKCGVSGRYFSKIYNETDNGDTEEGVYGSYENAFFMDAKVTVTPVTWLNVSLSVDNILDEDGYQYYKLDGRTWFFEAGVEW